LPQPFDWQKYKGGKDTANVAQSPAAAEQKSSTTTNPTRHRRIDIIFYSLVFGGLIISVVTSVVYEYVPLNIIEDNYNTPTNDLSILLFRASTLQVPLRNVFTPFVTNMSVVVVHNQPNITVNTVQLTTPNSFLTYSGSFDHLLSCDQNGIDLFPNKISRASCYPTTYGFDKFGLSVKSQHNLEVGNSSNPYTIEVDYTNGTHTPLYRSILFSWPIKTLDFNLLSYFFIVLIGVIVSRLFKNYSESQPRQTGLETVDYLWIAFSAVIALLIFANFQQQVHLTTHIIINISLAFGFGFGFDKVLEAGQKLERKHSG
jgi:hypothetical protein